MNARNVPIIAVASTAVALGGIAWAWRSAPSEETLACDGNQHNDIESEKDEWREFQTYHGPGETRGENKITAGRATHVRTVRAPSDCPARRRWAVTTPTSIGSLTKVITTGDGR